MSKFILYLFDAYKCCLHSTSVKVRRYLSHIQWILHEQLFKQKTEVSFMTDFSDIQMQYE